MSKVLTTCFRFNMDNPEHAKAWDYLHNYDKDKIKKTGELVGSLSVKENDEIMLINTEGIIIRMSASEVSKLGRATQGVKLMRVEDDSNIIAIAKVVQDENQSNEEQISMEMK